MIITPGNTETSRELSERRARYDQLKMFRFRINYRRVARLQSKVQRYWLSFFPVLAFLSPPTVNCLANLESSTVYWKRNWIFFYSFRCLYVFFFPFPLGHRPFKTMTFRAGNQFATAKRGHRVERDKFFRFLSPDRPIFSKSKANQRKFQISLRVQISHTSIKRSIVIFSSVFC